MMQVLAKGVDLSENGQALDAIREVDPAIDEALNEFMAKKKAAVPDSNV